MGNKKLARAVQVLAAIGLALVGATMPADAQSVGLAAGGKALLGISVGAHPSDGVRQAAQTLAQYLQRMTDAKFDVTNGGAGVLVGLPGDFPAITLPRTFDAKDPTRREEYVIRSDGHGLWVIGATDQAVEDAVWDLLYRLGYRQFFPGADWEVVPHIRDLSVDVNAHESPSYYARRIWYGYGAGDFGKAPYAQWCAKNRMILGIDLKSGHSYDAILHANRAAFAAHPEYLGLVDGKRTSTKFCISNPGLRKLVVDYELKKFAADPTMDSISLEPSDGGGWCQCDQCAKLGSITDRALLLANEVAAAVNAKYPGKFVGMYAYNYHSPPPDIAADPHVVVSVATAFIKGGDSLDDLLNGWSAKTHLLGIREYYEVSPWDRDMPAQARGGNIDYLKRTLPHFYAKGARFISAESGDSWGPDGLGFYLASRMMWDVRQADHVDELTKDFLARSFGAAQSPMAEFYQQIDGSKPHLVKSDQLGRMFRALAEARKLADSPAVTARLDDLLLYCRYVDLFTRYSKTGGAARQAAFEAVIRHAYHMRRTMMVHSLAIYRDLPHRDKSVTLPPDAEWKIAEGKNPWKSSAPFTADELNTYLAEGIARYPLSKVAFKPIAFSENLVSSAPLKFPESPAGSLGACRGKRTIYTRVETAPATIDLLITGGLIEHYRDRGNVSIQLDKIGGPSQTGQLLTFVAQDHSVPPDGKQHAVQLKVSEPGLYQLTINDGNDRTLVQWNCPLPMTIKSTLDEPMNKSYEQWQMYFYVPKGTTVIGLFGGQHGEVHDSAGRPVFWLNGRQTNYYSFDVPQGQDGKLWSMRFVRGPVALLTVPSYFSPTPGGLLLPAEVVERDAGH